MKSFIDLSDAEVELRQITTSVRPLLPVTASIVSMRGRKPSVKKVGTSRKSKLFQNISSLEKLREQEKVLDNLIANVKSQFVADDPNVKRILTSAEKLKKTISQHLEEEQDNSNERTQDHISPEATQLAKQIKSYYTRKLGIEADISYADGLKDGQHIMTVYVTFHNLKNFAGEISPQHVIAITQIGDEFYINPGLTKQVAPGKFNKGFEVESRNSAIRYIDAQLEADSNLSTISPKPLPVGSEHFKTTKAKKLVFKDNTISATLPATIKTPQKAQEVANALYVELKHTVASIDPRNKDRIVYALKKSKLGYVVQFKFTSGSASHSKTLKREQLKALQQMFTSDEINIIRRALS